MLPWWQGALNFLQMQLSMKNMTHKGLAKICTFMSFFITVIPSSFLHIFCLVWAYWGDYPKFTSKPQNSINQNQRASLNHVVALTRGEYAAWVIFRLPNDPGCCLCREVVVDSYPNWSLLTRSQQGLKWFVFVRHTGTWDLCVLTTHESLSCFSLGDAGSARPG